jgi:hypothetical protein
MQTVRTASVHSIVHASWDMKAAVQTAQVGYPLVFFSLEEEIFPLM